MNTGARVIGTFLLAAVSSALFATTAAPAQAAVSGSAHCADIRQVPRATLTPHSGPVGTRVTLTAHLPRAEYGGWYCQLMRHWGNLALIGHFAVSDFPVGSRPTDLDDPVGGCVLDLGLIDDAWHLNRRSGHVTGSFVVASTGACEHSLGTAHAALPGRYLLHVGSGTVPGAQFTVMANSLAMTGSPLAVLGTAALTATLTGAMFLVIGRKRGRRWRSREPVST